MKSLLEEEPTELLGLEEDNDPTDSIGFEDQEEEDDPREMMGFGEDEGEDDDSLEFGESEKKRIRSGCSATRTTTTKRTRRSPPEPVVSAHQACVCWQAPGQTPCACDRHRSASRTATGEAVRDCRASEAAACQAGRLAGRACAKTQSPACRGCASGTKARSPAGHRCSPRQASPPPSETGGGSGAPPVGVNNINLSARRSDLFNAQ